MKPANAAAMARMPMEGMRTAVTALLASTLLAGPAFAGLDYPAVTGAQVLDGALVKSAPSTIDAFSDLNFVIVGATGVSGLDGKQLAAVKSQMVNGERVVDFQMANEPNKDWIKGVRVVFYLDSGTLKVRYDKAYYYKYVYGLGTYTWDDYGNTEAAVNFNDNTSSLYNGSGNGYYGIKEIYLTDEIQAVERSEALPEGDVSIGSLFKLVLKGDAASGTIANNIAVSNATLTIDATESVEYSGTISGERSTINIKTSGAVASEDIESGEDVVVTEDSANDMPNNYTAYVLLFEGAKLEDLTAESFHSGDLIQNGTTHMEAHPFYFNRSADGLSATLELQYQNTGDNWVKCCKIELTERSAGVYGRRVQGFYYTGKSGDPSYEGTKTWENHGTDSDIRTSDYGVGRINATFTRHPAAETFTLANGMCSAYASSGDAAEGMQGLGDPTSYSERHMYAIAANGYDLGDLESVNVASHNFGSDVKLEKTLRFSDALGPVWQYQALTTGNRIRCVFFRLVQTAENDILAYSVRSCEFDATREDVVFGEDLTDVPADAENRRYHILSLQLAFARTAVPVVAALTGANACTNSAIVIAEGSRARILAAEALPKNGSIEARENSRLTIDLGTVSGDSATYSGESCALTVRRGAVVTTLGRTGMRGAGSSILVEGGLVQFMGNNEFVWDQGDYFPKIELKDGGCITGYSPRGDAQRAFHVTGTGCSTNDAGVMLGIGSATGVYPVIVNDTTGDPGVDLEFSGPISAHGGAKLGGIAKQGAGTMRLTSRYMTTDPWMRLDEGTLVVGRSNMWSGERLVAKGGTLEVESGVVGNAVASFDLQGTASLVLGDGATLDLGDCTGAAWASGVKLSVSFGAGARLFADVTDAQLERMRGDDNCRLARVNGRELRTMRGFMILFR